nr:MAG TPA: hypothetical protein [Caudoviricetes sp.]
MPDMISCISVLITTFCAVFFMGSNSPFMATGNRKNEHCSSRLRVIGWS